MVWAGLEDKGQTVSKQDVRVEQKVSVALLASRDANCFGGKNKDETWQIAGRVRVSVGYVER